MDKWLKMLKKWGKYRHSDKVRRRRTSTCPEGWEWCIRAMSQAFEKLVEKPESTGKCCLILPLPLSLEYFKSFLEAAGYQRRARPILTSVVYGGFPE